MHLEGNYFGDIGDIENSASHGPGKSGLAGRALSRGIGLEALQRHLSASIILCYQWYILDEE